MKTIIKIFTAILVCSFMGGVMAHAIGEAGPLVHLGLSTAIFITSNFLIPSGALTIICAPNCLSTIPLVIGNESCEFIDRKGGISRMTFLKCQYIDTPPNFRYSGEWTNPLNVRDAICSGILYVTGEILGSKPAPSFTKKRLSSCSPEKTIAGTQTIVFTDYNHDPENLIEFDFYGAIEENKAFLAFGWISCDDLWYQHNGDWDMEAGEQTEDTSDGNAFFAGTVTISKKNILKPIRCTGVNAMLKAFNGVCDYYL